MDVNWVSPQIPRWHDLISELSLDCSHSNIYDFIIDTVSLLPGFLFWSLQLADSHWVLVISGGHDANHFAVTVYSIRLVILIFLNWGTDKSMQVYISITAVLYHHRDFILFWINISFCFSKKLLWKSQITSRFLSFQRINYKIQCNNMLPNDRLSSQNVTNWRSITYLRRTIFIKHYLYIPYTIWVIFINIINKPLQLEHI